MLTDGEEGERHEQRSVGQRVPLVLAEGGLGRHRRLPGSRRRWRWRSLGSSGSARDGGVRDQGDRSTPERKRCPIVEQAHDGGRQVEHRVLVEVARRDRRAAHPREPLVVMGARAMEREGSDDADVGMLDRVAGERPLDDEVRVAVLCFVERVVGAEVVDLVGDRLAGSHIATAPDQRLDCPALGVELSDGHQAVTLAPGHVDPYVAVAERRERERAHRAALGAVVVDEQEAIGRLVAPFDVGRILARLRRDRNPERTERRVLDPRQEPTPRSGEPGGLVAR